jgi:hypothetical protein
MDAVANYGILSLLPVTAVIVTAIITKRALEPLIIGTLIGFFILDGPNFVFSYLDSLYLELGESAYFIIIFWPLRHFHQIAGGLQRYIRIYETRTPVCHQ